LKSFLNRKDEEESERKKGANYENRRSEWEEGRREKKGKKQRVVAN